MTNADNIIRNAAGDAIGMRFVIPGRLDGLNEYVAENRKAPKRGASNKRKNEQVVMNALFASGLSKAKFSKPVSITFTWIEPNRKRDKDNISSYGRKVILDALVKSDVLLGDGWKYVDGFTDRFKVDEKDPRIEVTVIETDALKDVLFEKLSESVLPLVDSGLLV